MHTVMSVQVDFSLHLHLFFIADPEEYNCSIKTAEQWESMKVPSLVEGTVFILLAVISLAVYGLLFLAMTSREILRNSCFKLMYFNCLIDSGGLITGYLFTRGDVYCTNPFWTYTPGSVGLGCWSASCVICLALAISRICAIHRSEWGSTVTYSVIMISMCHCVFMMFCTRTVVFNAPRGSWFFSPHIQNEFYANSYHLTENVLVTLLTPIMYGYVCIKLFCKPASDISKSNRRMQISVCLQSFLICANVSVAAVLFAYMQVFTYPPWVPLAAEIAYTICGTLPAAVLLLVNKKIRARAKCVLQFVNPSTIRIASISRASERMYKIPSEPPAVSQSEVPQ